MKKKPLLVLCILLIMVFAVGLTACTGSYAMEEFIVDFSKFKKEYEVGDVVDLSQIDISATFNDGTTEKLPLKRVTLLLDGEKIEPDEVAKITETAGTKTLEIKFTDIVKSVVIIVNEKHVPVLTGVEMTTNGVATEYIVKSEVSLAGLKVFAVYDNGAKKEEIALTDKNVSVFMDEENVTDNYNRITEEVGVKSIRVKYGVFTTKDSLTINVSDVLSVINVTLPDTFKNTYKVGEKVSFAGIKATATYRSGKTEDIAEIKYYIGEEEVNFDTLTATKGTKTIVAKAVLGEKEGKTEINLTINDYIVGISFGEKVSFETDIDVTSGSVYSFPDLEVYANYKSGDCVKIDSGYTFIGNSITEPTTGKKVIVKYGDFSGEVTLVVNDVLSAINVTLPDTFKTTYKVGEKVSFTGIKATATYRSGKTEDIAEIKYYIGEEEVNFDTLTATKGTKTIVAKATSGEVVGTKEIVLSVENYVDSISLITDGALPTYIVNDVITIDSFGVIKINVVYADTQDNKQISLTAEGVSCLDAEQKDLDFAKLTNTAGEKVVTVSYGGKRDSFTINVTDGETALESLTVTAPTKTAYTAGEAGVTFAGLAITAAYKAEYARPNEFIQVSDFADKGVKVFFNDNRLTDYDDVTKITTEGADQSFSVQVSYEGKTASFNITITNNVVSVAVDESHAKTAYKLDEKVDFSGLTVTATLNNGTKTILLDDVTFFDGTTDITNDLDSLTKVASDSKTVTVSYGGQTDTFVITVNDYIVGISFGEKISFETDIDVTPGSVYSFPDLEVYADYKSGVKTRLLSGYSFTSNGITELTTTAGKDVTVTYGDFSGKVTLVVNDVLNNINISCPEDLKTTYKVDEKVSFAGVKATATYRSGKTEDIAEIKYYIGEEEVDINTLTATAGTKRVVAKAVLGDKEGTAEINITVNDYIVGISFGEKVSFETDIDVTPGSVYSFPDLEVYADYKSGNREKLDSGYTFTSNGITELTTTAGKDVTVTYGGFSGKVTLVVNDVLNNINISCPEDLKTTYKVDEKVSFAGVKATATYRSGKTEDIAEIKYYIGEEEVDINTLTATAGTKRVVAKAVLGDKEGTAEINITVNDYIVGISFGEKVSFETDIDVTPGSVYSFPDLEVYTDYKSGARKKVDTGYTFENNSITAPASGKTVTVIYEEFSGTVTLTVNDVLQSIVVTNIPTFAYGTDAAKTLKNITVTGTYVYKGAANIIILQEDKENFLYGLVSFAMKKGEEYETLTQLDLNEITSSSGTKELKITITENGRSVSYEFSVTVTAPAPGVSEFSLPESVVAYQTTITSSQAAQNDKTAKAFESAYFVNGTEEYLVGDDNPFKFVPRLKQVNIETGSLTELTTYQTASKVYYNGSALTESVSGNKKTFSYEGTVMVEENFMQNTFDFTSDAIGKSFKLSVLPSRDQFDYESSEFTAVEWTVKVVDGYNITDAKELCLLEQPSAYSTRTYWNSIKAELGLTGVRPNSIILHQNTIVTKDSIPSEFYYTLPDSYDIKYKYTDKNGVEHSCKPEEVPADYGGGNLSRTFLWDDEYALFEYDMTSGSSFTIHGNFFDIDLSRMPLVAAFEPYGVTVPSYMSGTYYGQYMSKVSFLEVRGIEGTTGAGDESFTFNNFAVKGNAAINQVLVDGSSNIKQGTDNPVFGGGLIFVKTRYCTSDIVNIHAHACFIPFYSRNKTVVNYTNAKAYDSFQNALFVNSDSVNNLNNCYFKRAGGPLMILVESSEKVNDVDVKLIPKVYADDNCELESLVTGNSQWFVTYGVTQNVAQLAALDPLLQGYFARTLLNGGQFNVIAVSIEEGGGGSAGTQAYMSYKNNAINRLNGQPSFETTKALAGYGFGAFFLMGDAVCAPYTTDGVNYSLVNSSVTDCATDGTIQTAFRNRDNQYVAIYAGGMGILAELY